MTNKMKKELKQQFNQQIKRLQALLDGETVDGMKLGAAGLDAKWATETIVALRGMLNNL